MLPINERLNENKPILADGAMGSLLMKYGLKAGECPEQFNLSNPGKLEDIARLYFEAGAEIIQTNTFGGCDLRLKEYRLDSQAEKIVETAVQAVRNVVGDKAYVSGSCGPCGKMLLPYGDAEPEIVYNSFERQMRSFANAGVNLICVETMIDLKESVLAIKAAKTICPDIPVMATMTFDKTPRGYYTAMGNSIINAFEKLKEAGADIIGSNCGNGIENMIEIAREFMKITDRPVIIQSNAGIPVVQNGELFYPENPQFFAHKCKELISMGISIIGGCCGTNPEHIRAVRKVIG